MSELGACPGVPGTVRIYISFPDLLLIRPSHSQRGSVCSVPSYPSLHADSVLTLAFPLLVEVKVKANLQEEFQAQVCSVVAAVGLSALGMEQSLQVFDTLKIKALRKVKFTKPHRRAGIWGDPFWVAFSSPMGAEQWLVLFWQPTQQSCSQAKTFKSSRKKKTKKTHLFPVSNLYRTSGSLKYLTKHFIQSKFKWNVSPHPKRETTMNSMRMRGTGRGNAPYHLVNLFLFINLLHGTVGLMAFTLKWKRSPWSILSKKCTNDFSKIQDKECVSCFPLFSKNSFNLSLQIYHFPSAKINYQHKKPCIIKNQSTLLYLLALVIKLLLEHTDEFDIRKIIETEHDIYYLWYVITLTCS